MKYPILEIDLKKLESNVNYIVNKCGEKNINIAGVIKGANGIDKVVDSFIKSGVSEIASSRIEQLKDVKDNHHNTKTMLIRIPMLSELDLVVDYADYSLHSEKIILDKTNEKAKAKNIVHNVIIMADLGDLREGYIDYDELIETAIYVEEKLDNLYLKGIGVNLGCYGSIKPTYENLTKLCDIALSIEKRINRQLDIISGGATSSFTLVLDNNIPNRINHLRIGEQILLNRDLPSFYGYDVKEMYDDIFILKTEVIEKKDKPSFPIGEIFIDAFGNKPEYTDIGIHTRALFGIGKQDIGDFDKLIPINDKIKLIGASSDHLIADITLCRDEINVGDIVEFKLCYQSMLFLTGSSYVEKVFKE